MYYIYINNLKLKAMKKSIAIAFFAAVITNSLIADTVPTNVVKLTPLHETVAPSKIIQLQDSLEKDSLLEFTIDQISYLNMDSALLKKVLEDIDTHTYPTQMNGFLQTCQTHYSYDEENKKVYNGATYVSIETDDLVTTITIFWSKPSVNAEILESNK